MNIRALRSDLLLLLTACVWGFAFVAQKKGSAYIEPFYFNGIRFLMGGVSLVPFIAFRRSRGALKRSCALGKPLFLASLLAGSCLFIAASLQQIGIMSTTEGHSGFITGLYVVLTPIAGIFIGRKTGIPTWIGVTFTLVGLFFLCVADNVGQINSGDLLTLISALFWTGHVLAIDKLVQKHDALLLSAGQFIWVGVFSLLIALFRETISLTDIYDCLPPLLYSGLCSVGVAYTLQVVAQKEAPPAHATIIMCLEGVFAAVGGVIFSGNILGTNTITGFVLMLCGMLLSQWDLIRQK
ncbi:permease [Spirochaetia bacterium]|nr:permease [Spirochaetia bacterium]